MDGMMLQDLTTSNLAAAAGRVLALERPFGSALDVIVDALPDPEARLAALRRLVAAIEDQEDRSLPFSHFPARALAEWLGDPSRSRKDVVSVFRRAMGEVTHA